MERRELLDALVQAKRMGNLIHEVMDLSTQLADSLDRGDQVAVRMLLAMRREPIGKLEAADRALRNQRDSAANSANGLRLAALLKGEPAETEEEKPLADQIASNRRLLQRVRELDRNLNRKLTREKSVYQ